MWLNWVGVCVWGGKEGMGTQDGSNLGRREAEHDHVQNAVGCLPEINWEFPVVSGRSGEYRVTSPAFDEVTRY